MSDATGAVAESPSEIGIQGWKSILWRVKSEIGSDRIGLIAAGIAFYGIMALFPAITAIMAISGIFLDPADIASQVGTISSILPEQAAEIILGQATEIAGSQEGGLGIAALVGLALAIYSASKGVGNLVEGLNIAYNETETRGFIHRTALVLGLTAMLVIGMVFGLGTILVLPGLLEIVSLGWTTELLISVVKWVILFVATVFGISALYRFGPNRSAAEWKWIFPGAMLACILWILGSAGFAIYAETFGSYNETFGTLAGAIVLLFWLWISAYAILLGAELNSEAEAQTQYDTTVGQDMPLGSRGATAADSYKAEAVE